MNKVIEKIKKNFSIGEPIFSSEILELNRDISRQMVYSYLKEGLNIGEIKKNEDYYYIPKIQEICGIKYDNIPSYKEIINKKYIKNKGKVYGVYSGRTLENKLNISEQVPFVEEIVSNKITKMRKDVMVGKNKVVLRKPFVKIDNNNIKEYTVMQLMNDSDINLLREKKFMIKNYIKKNKITKEELIRVGKSFPQKALKKLEEIKLYE